MTVKRRRFGTTPHEISEIGFGCGGYWGYSFFSEAAAERLVLTAIDEGVNYFDTGPNYSGGNAEVRLGRILKGRMDGVFLATKVGSKLSDRGKLVRDFSPAAMRSSLEESLRRLGTDHIHLVQLHSPPVEVVESEEVAAALRSLKDDGLVSYVGLSGSGAKAEAAIRTGTFDSLMTTYNIFRHGASAPIMRDAAAAGMAVMAMSPLAHALYSPSLYRIRSMSQIWYLRRAFRNSPKGLMRARRYRFLNEVEGWTATAIALKFVLENEHVNVAIIGTTKLDHLKANLAVSGGPALPEDVARRLRGE